MRRSLSLLIAAAAVAGSIATAAPAHAWSCATDDVLPEQVGKPVCVAVTTVAGWICHLIPSACS